MNAPPTAREIAAFLLVALIWGSTWLVIKDQLGFAPAGWSVVWRFVFAAIAMAALAKSRRQSLAPRGALLGLATVLGLFQFVGNFQFVYGSEQYLTSGVVAVVFALLLVPNALLARVFYGAPVSRRFLAGSAVAIGGIALLILNQLRVAPPSGQVGLGLAMVIGGMLCASVANVMQTAPAVRAHPLLVVLAWAMAIGAGLDAALAWANFGPPPLALPLRYWLGVLYLALFGSVLTFPLYFGLIRSWGAGRAAYNGVLTPVIAMALSTVFEGYRWTTLGIAGSLLAIIGLLIALASRSASPSR